MRVLLVSILYSGGGAERCARELFHHLPERGLRTEMWTAARHPGDPPGVRSLRLPLERWLLPLDWALHHNDWRHAGSRWSLGRITRRDFDVVHFHNVHGNWLSIRAMHDLCTRVPVVWTLHDAWAATGGIPYELDGLLPESELRRLSRRSYRTLPYHATWGVKRLRRFLSRWMPRPAALISPSQYMAQLLAKSGRFPGVPIRHLPNGLTLLDEPAVTLPRAEARTRLRLPADRPVVLMVANNLDDACKGLDLGLEVLRGLPAPRRPAVLLLGRNAEPLLRRLAGFEVVTTYAADAKTLATAYRAADVTLVPSRADNLPYVVLESFACRTPVAAFAVGGLVEMLAEQRGLLARPFDVGELGDQLLRLLDEAPLRATLAEAAHGWVTRECSMRTYLDRMIAVYEEVSQRSLVAAPPEGIGRLRS